MPQEPTTSAALHSGDGTEPVSKKTPVKGPPPDDTWFQPKKRERAEDDLTPKSEQAEVKEEQEGSAEEVPSMQLRSPDRLYHTVWIEHDSIFLNAHPHEDPLTQVKNEMWNMRANFETLRTRLRDTEDLHEGQES